MSKAFEKCVRRGGKINIVTGKNAHFEIPEDHYRRICTIKDKVTKGPLKQVKTNGEN